MEQDSSSTSGVDLYGALESSLPDDKVVLVGNPGVGKSTIYHRFKTGQFVHTDELSYRKDEKEHRRQWTVDGTPVSMTLFDTAGVERYTQTIPHTYYRRAKVVMMVYSMDNSDSFYSISSNWIDNATAADESAITVLVGNKLDLLNNRDSEKSAFITGKKAHVLAENWDIESSLVFEVSALTGEGFQELFDSVALKLTPAHLSISTVPKYSVHNSLSAEESGLCLRC